jgi:LysM repeat protein
MNKKNKTHIALLLIFAFCFFPNYFNAQTKSTEIKIINGKKYYIHKVEKGQSLYAIAKTYEVDINYILAENEEAIEGIKNGQELKIPFEKNVAKPSNSIDTNKYVYHKIKKSETIYSISKTYNLNEKQLSIYNPQINKGIKEGEYLIIAEKKTPIKKYDDNGKNNVSTSTYSLYTVLQGETLTSISKKNSVAITELIKLNPEINNGLKSGQQIKIPTVVRKIADVSIPTSTLNSGYTKSVNEIDSIIFNKPKKKYYNIGLFLPFKLKESELFTVDDLLKSQASFPATQNMALDFYLGFKKAIDSLTSKNFVINISLFDVQENDSVKVEDIFRTEDFKKLDLIFGPLYAGVFKQLSKRAKTLQIPCISPILSQSKILYNNNLVSKVTPSQYTLIESLADFAFDSLAASNNIIVCPTNKDLSYARAFKDRYKENLLKANKSLKDTICQVKNLEGVKSKYVLGKKNVVIVLTNNPVFLQDFITQLSLFADKKDFLLMGFENNISIDNLDQAYFNKLNFHFATAHKLDNSDLKTRDLVMQYQQVYAGDPSEYYFEGFDIATYYFSNLKNEGPNMFINLEKFTYDGILCGFKFYKPDSVTGYENKAVSIFKYSNFKLQKLGWR